MLAFLSILDLACSTHSPDPRVVVESCDLLPHIAEQRPATPRLFRGCREARAAAAAGAEALRRAAADVVLENVYVSGDPVFVHFVPGKPWADLLKLTPSYGLANLTAPAFWRDARPLNPRLFRYWAGPIDVFKAPMRSALAPLLSLAASVNVDVIRHGIWLSDAGVTAPLHYDTYFNIFTQLVGHKTVTVCDPSALASAQLFPSWHPQYRQAQVALNPIQYAAFLHANLCFQITLTPGEILIIPPFHLHDTKAQEKSASVNTWLADSALERAEDIFNAPVPIEIDWPLAKIARGLQAYIGELLRLLAPNYQKERWAERFSFLAAATGHAKAKLRADHLDLLSWCAPRASDTDCDEAADLLQRAERGARMIAAILAPLQQAQVRQVYVDDLIEEVRGISEVQHFFFIYIYIFFQMVSFFLGVQAVPIFTECCF